MSLIRKNLLFNLINSVTSILFPIITMPYVLRVLLPEGIGTLDFLNSIITYVALFTSLGIPFYAVKEVAKNRDTPEKLQNISIEIFLLSVFLGVFGFVVIIALGCTIEKILEFRNIFFVLGLSVLFNAFSVSWFFQAIEDFKFITIRSLIVRILSIIAVFIFVKNQDDLIKYALITVVSSIGGGILNFNKFRKYIALYSNIQIKKINIKQHIRPSVEMFVLSLIISIYVNLDIIMLGFMKGNEVVGYYSTSIKFYRIILTLVTSLGVVLLPRMSNIVGNNDQKEFVRLSKKSLDFTCFIGFPLTFGLIILAKPIIFLFAGNQYFPSILSLQILSPIVLLAGVTNVFGIQVLYPLNKQRLVIYSVLAGAIINLALNLVLIPKFSHYGAAVATLIAEILVFIYQVYYIKKYVGSILFSKSLKNIIIGTCVMSLSMVAISFFNFKFSVIYQTILNVFVGGIVYFAFMFLIKEHFIINLLKSILKK